MNERIFLQVFGRFSVTGMIYDKILKPYIHIFKATVGSDFILMDENARPHRAHAVDEFKESENVRRMN